MRRKRGEETGLVRQILEYLSLRGIWAYRVNTGALRDSTGRPVFFGVKGHPDIVARLKPRRGSNGSGRVVWIEAKSSKGVLSENQKEWQKKSDTYGDVFIVAKKLEDVMALFEGKP
jgi:hypothetical protein